MDIQTDQDLIIIAEELAKQAMQAISEELIGIFKKNYLRKYVYNSHGKNEIYYNGSGRATYQFEESWEWTEIVKMTDRLVMEMWYNPDEMQFDRDSFLHGSKYSSPSDVRDNLMDILNKKGFSSSLWLSVSRPVAYWDKFLEDMFSGGVLDQIMAKHFIRAGFTRA